jgi:uncharacterized damage-inducible protein DinB
MAEINHNQEFAAIFLKGIRKHLLEENWPRLKKCVLLCDDAMLWSKPNENTNSIGNLVLHLQGNLAQWVLHGIAGAADKRIRNKEFETGSKRPKEQLLSDFELLMQSIDEVLINIEPNKLTEKRKVQGFETTVTGILIHVTEHFSYHLGQISFILKQAKNIDLKYYEGMNLDSTG